MEIRLIADGEGTLCNDFHNRVYNDNRTYQQWEWAFVLNTYKKKPIPYAVVVDEGKIVGTQTFIPIRMIDADGVYWTAKSEGTLLEPDYRGRQLFKGMYEYLFDYAQKREFACIWGFTAAIKALKPIGFIIPAVTEQIFIPFSNRSISSMLEKKQQNKKENVIGKLKPIVLRSGCVLAQAVSAMKIALNKKRLIDKLDVRTWTEPDEKTGDLCKRFIQRWGGTTIYRDAEYLQWRLFDNPYLKSIVRAVYDQNRLLGWVAFTLGDDGLGYLVDLMVNADDSEFAIEDLISLLLYEAVIGTRNMGATGIRGWRVNNHPFDRLIFRAAKKIGFYHVRRGHSVVLYNCEAGKKRISYNKFDNWFVTRIFTEGVLG